MQTSSAWLIESFEAYARSLPRRTPEIPVGHPAIGHIGVCQPGKGFKTKGMSSRSFYALMRDEDRAFKNPQKYLGEMGAITTWDNVLAARVAGACDDRLYFKANMTTVAANWSSSFRSAGLPSSGAYANAPNGSTMNSASAGAFFLADPGAGNNRYLLNFGAQHLTGTNIVLLVDLLLAANNILTSSANNTALTLPELTRYTDGVGVMMTFEVANAIGASAANITVTYNNTNNANSITAAIALTASAANFRLQPIGGGAMVQLAANDLGVRTVTNVQISANMGTGGILALNLYKPLLLIPTLANTTYVERSTPGMLSGITLLPKEAGNALGCLTVYVNTSTTSTGIQTYFLQTVEG